MINLNFETFEPAIQQQLREIPLSGVIHVSHNGKPIFSHAYGYANRSESIPNRLNTRFGIASGGKLFTATAIAQLVQQGKISFDQVLVDFLDGELPQVNTKITLRHLLSHTSGVPDYFDESILDDYEAYWLDKPVYRMLSAKDFFPLIANLPMQSTPGEKFNYNNMGFVLLGYVVEKVSGQRFQDYIEEKIFGPAWMRSSGYYFSNRLPEHVAQGYIEEKDGSWHTNQFALPIVGHGDGGVYTTAADYGRFWKALFEMRYFKDEILQEMLKPNVPVSQDGISQYGLGIWINDIAPTRCYYVTGEDPGVNFYSAVYPEVNLQITILGNSNDAVWPLSKVIRAEIFGLTKSD
ncbi:MAG: serine hydrolase domain-containing protein [Anaerolineaceae bacterium]